MTRHPQGRKPIVTRAGVLHVLSREGVNGMSQAEIAANFNVTAAAAGNVIRLLLSTGDLVVARKGSSNGCTQFYAIPEHKKRLEVVPAFRPDNWKPAMKGYAAGLHAFAERAMATRRA